MSSKTDSFSGTLSAFKIHLSKPLQIGMLLGKNKKFGYLLELYRVLRYNTKCMSIFSKQ